MLKVYSVCHKSRTIKLYTSLGVILDTQAVQSQKSSIALLLVLYTAHTIRVLDPIPSTQAEMKQADYMFRVYRSYTLLQVGFRAGVDYFSS